MLRYKIDVLKELKEHGYNQTIISKENIFGQASLTNIRHGKVVGINNLEKLCKLLNLQPGDIIEYVEEDKESNKQ